MNILFYYPDKERAVSLSSLMIAFREQGHHVYLLTHADEGDLHDDVRASGVKLFTYPIKKSFAPIFYLKHIFYLARFTKENRIDVVYSHIQRANLISVFAQLISPARFILCRHHSDCAIVDKNFNERTVDRFINTLGKEFIVPSDKVYNQMVKVEKVNPKKIYLIRYAYDFSAYSVPKEFAVNAIREKYKAKLLLVKVARLIPEKRHYLLFEVVNKLVKIGMDIKLLVLSDGVERDALNRYILENQLENHIFMIGYRTDVVDFIASSDVVVHVSETEASSNLAKEVGLLKRPLMVCRDVGDFDEYIIDGRNGILVDKDDPSHEVEEKIKLIYHQKMDVSKLGEELYRTIINRFSIKTILSEYNQFNAGK